MEKLPETQRKALTKTSDARLVQKLLNAGVTVEQVETMDRQAMLAAAAELILSGKEVTGHNVQAAYDPELERQKFAWQRQCYEKELELKTKREEQERDDKLRAQQAQFELEKEKLRVAEQEMHMKRDQLEKDRQQKAWQLQVEDEERELRVRSAAAKAKIFGDAMRSASVKMGDDPIDAISFFNGIENSFNIFSVPDNLKVDLMRPYLSQRAVAFLTQLDAKQLQDYEVVKKHILSQLRLSPRLFLEQFNTIARKYDETAVLFGTRLKTLLKYYLHSRSVSGFDELFSLLVSDRLKATLNDDCLKYVLSIEATIAEGWLPYDKLADVIDNYYANRVRGRPRVSAISITPEQAPTRVGDVRKVVVNTQQVVGQAGRGKSTGGPPGQATTQKRCYSCGGPHLRRDCPQKGPAGGAQSTTGRRERQVQVHQASVEAPSGGTAADGSLQVQANQCVVAGPLWGRRTESTCGGDLDPLTTGPLVPRANVDSEAARGGANGGPQLAATMVGLPGSDTVAEADIPAGTEPGLSLLDCVETLTYVDVMVTEVPGKVIRALNDSGCQLSIIKKQVLNGYTYPACGTVQIRGLLGNADTADLTYLSLSLPECPDVTLRIMCAVSDNVQEDMILPSAVVTRMNDRFNIKIAAIDTVVKTVEPLSSVGSCDNDKDDALFLEVDTVDNLDVDPNEITVMQLKNEQVSDSSLRPLWVLAKQGKGKVFIKDGLLFRYEKICGRDMECLLVPEGRRQYVIDVAHTVTGGHFNYRKTRDRIKLSGLTWDTLTRDCKLFVQKCEVCQKMARTTCFDRIPISPVPRSPHLFAHFFADCFGPVLSDQHVKFNYCLVLVDSHSLWVSAYPLRNLTAKSICLALLNMFAYTGLSSEVTMLSTDNATYFKAELTREFLKRIGVSPRFHTPHASWSTGLVERHLQTVKRVVGKLAADHPKQWAEYLPYALWALRESVSNPLQMQPFMMVTGGRPMRGPLSILRDTWLGFRNLPISLGKRTEDFLAEVKAGLEAAQEYAGEHVKEAQRRYVSHYNLRTKPKKFQVGQQCLILQPDNTTSRMFARWKGPATVVETKFPDSYVVELTGRRYHLHANHLRPYVVEVETVTCMPEELSNLMCTQGEAQDIDSRPTDVDCIDHDVNVNVQYCSVIYDADTDFGDVGEVGPIVDQGQPPTPARPGEDELSHLSAAQRGSLLGIIDEFADCFSSVPGLCKAVVHEIPTTADFVPKRIKGYRIPEPLREEVERQIMALLKTGFIRESSSPMSSPIVAVIKPSGGVRVCVNYQYLNRYTIPDQMPLPDISTIIHKVGNARFITTFDAPSSYHQCEIAEGDRWKTAFVCGSSLYEWVRCPFGLRSSGCSFVRAMNRILSPVRAFTANYVDDVAVYSMEWEPHLDDIRAFLTVVRRSGFTFSLAKARWARPQVTFLGHVIGSGERRPDPDKVAAVKDLRVPETKKQVRQVLGFFGHFAEYLEGYARLAHPLTALTGKKYVGRIPWGQREQEAFDTLKERLIKATLEPLGVIDYRRPFVIMVDSCEYAVGGILVQETPSGVHRPVCFASHQFSETQRRWATIEKECFATIWALQKFKQWIFQVPTVIQTDHNPLVFLTDTAPKNAKLMRWLLAVQEFNNVQFQFRAGAQNAAADCVSRMVYPDDRVRN